MRRATWCAWLLAAALSGCGVYHVPVVPSMLAPDPSGVLFDRAIISRGRLPVEQLSHASYDLDVFRAEIEATQLFESVQFEYVDAPRPDDLILLPTTVRAERLHHPWISLFTLGLYPDFAWYATGRSFEIRLPGVPETALADNSTYRQGVTGWICIPLGVRPELSWTRPKSIEAEALRATLLNALVEAAWWPDTGVHSGDAASAVPSGGRMGAPSHD